MDGQSSISPHALYTEIGTAASSIVLDVRRSPAFDADDRMLVSALRRTPAVLRLVLVLITLGSWSATNGPARAAEDTAALANAMKDATATLQSGLKTSEREGTPISAKFEVEDGKLQLSVYTVKDGGFIEVVADPKTGAIAKAEKITEADDLKEATAQKAAMAKAKVSLVTAAETAVKANAGSRAVSVYPQLQNNEPVAEVTLLAGTTFKKVMEKLD